MVIFSLFPSLPPSLSYRLMLDVGDSAGQPRRGSQGHWHVVVGRLQVGEDQPGAPVRCGGRQQREEQQSQHPVTHHTL